MSFSISRREALRLFTIALAGSTTACALRGKKGDIDDDSIVTLRVANHNVLDITVYSLRGTARDRLGLVTSNTTQTFLIRTRQLEAGGDLRLFADPVGARIGYTSEMVHVLAGESVDWTLENDLRRSFLAVRG
jgi:hypothetical protein